MNRNAMRLLKFAIQFQGWNAYGSDALHDLRHLEEHGLIVIDTKARKFRLATPDAIAEHMCGNMESV